MSDYLELRRQRAAQAWNLSHEIVLIGAGGPISIPGGADQVYPFFSHSEYFYLADRECPGAVIAYDPKDGWVDFVPEVTEAERVWEGRGDAPGTPLAQLAPWLGVRHGRAIVSLGVPLPGIRSEAGRIGDLRAALAHARRPKDEVEIDRLRLAAKATALGYEAARKLIRPGVTEREVQIEMEAGFFRGGADSTSYDTIVGGGPNSAVLHFMPTTRKFRAGEPVLIDAGGAVSRYCSDVTRTYRVTAAGGEMVAAGARSAASSGAGAADPAFFHDLYSLVLAVEERAIAGCVAGAEFRDLHLAAATQIAEGLVALGILRGKAEALVEQDAHALFFPHGLGHLVGLGVRDASGFLPGRKPSTRPGLANLRMDLPLEPGYVTTIEPGVYFIPALLKNAERRAKHRDNVDWARVDGLMEFGGVRIEDNVLVTSGAPEVLTAAVPKVD